MPDKKNRWTWDEVRAATQLAYSRGRSDEKRGQRRGGGGVLVDLAAWLEERAGHPCKVNIGEWCASKKLCEGHEVQEQSN